MQGKELVLKALKDKGVRYIFGYTGGAIMPIFDEMEKQKRFDFIMSRHEQGAVFMAQGISRASVTTNRPQIGVCLATSGPGAMNLVTGIADASMDSVPVLAITGQVPSGVIATDAFQESDVVGVMMPITKQTYMPLTVESSKRPFMKRFTWLLPGGAGRWWWTSPRMFSSRKPDRNIGLIPTPMCPTCRGFTTRPKPDRERLRQAVGLINHSERPIILCGHGVIAGRASAALLAFAERAHIPVAFTLHGLSALPMDHPLSLGMVGMHGTVEANRALLNADLILSFGMRFDDRVTGKSGCFRGERQGHPRGDRSLRNRQECQDHGGHQRGYGRSAQPSGPRP